MTVAFEIEDNVPVVQGRVGNFKSDGLSVSSKLAALNVGQSLWFEGKKTNSLSSVARIVAKKLDGRKFRTGAVTKSNKLPSEANGEALGVRVWRVA
jgi:hypothetical protein